MSSIRREDQAVSLKKRKFYPVRAALASLALFVYGIDVRCAISRLGFGESVEKPHA
jgi:hypothetical protein